MKYCGIVYKNDDCEKDTLLMIYNLDTAVRVRMFGHVSQKCGGWHNGARPSIDIVLYCTDGEINMQIDGAVFHVETGDLLIIPPNAFYRPLAGGSCQYYFFHFEAERLSDTHDIPTHIMISPHANLTDGFAYTCESQYRAVTRVQQHTKHAPYLVKSIFERAKDLKPNVSFSDQLRLDLLLRELLICMGEENSPKQNKRLTEIIAYIEKHYSDNLCLSALSKRFSLSKSYIARLFREEMSCKPSEYVNRIRISVAKAILLQTNMTVSEIAEKVGYSDIYYFSKIFKRIVGTSPLSMRR